MAGRIRIAIISPPGQQRLDTPLAEAIRARSRSRPTNTVREPREAVDAGYSVDGGTHSSDARLISSFNSLPGLK